MAHGAHVATLKYFGRKKTFPWEAKYLLLGITEGKIMFILSVPTPTNGFCSWVTTIPSRNYHS